MPTEVKTSVGRIVWGNPAKPQTKKIQEGPQKGQPVLKEGQPILQWAFGVAFPKAEFQRDIWPGMAAEAATGFPQGTPPKFAWKYVDGDGVDSDGQPFSKREGYAGCYILTISTEAFAPPIYRFQNGSYVQLNADQIKCGDFVALAIKFVLNIPTDRTRVPSLFVNPQAIEFVGYGQEIQRGPDPMALFGGQQRQLPPGASTTPVAPAGNVQMPGTGPQMMQPQHQPQPGQMQPMHQPQPGGYPQPQPGYTPPHDPRFTGGPQPGQMPMQPGNAPGPHYQPQPGQMQPMHQQPAQHVQPAHDFVQNAGHQQPGQMPMQQPMMQPGQMQPQYQPQPGMMPPNR